MELEKCLECGGVKLIGVPVGDWGQTPICDCSQNEVGSWVVKTRIITESKGSDMVEGCH